METRLFVANSNSLKSYDSGISYNEASLMNIISELSRHIRFA